ncbi:pilus assembly protein TadG-related protein [Cupriavidus basilensis]
MLRRLRGAVSVMTATFIATVGLAVLVSIDIGNLFYQQRALQRSADLAAMAAVQRLDLPTAAQQAVVQNGTDSGWHQCHAGSRARRLGCQRGHGAHVLHRAGGC